MDRRKSHSSSMAIFFAEIALLHDYTYKGTPIHQVSYTVIDPSESFITIFFIFYLFEKVNENSTISNTRHEPCDTISDA